MAAKSHHALRYAAHRATNAALADPNPMSLMGAATAHMKAAKAFRAAGLHADADGHEGHARLLGYAAKNPNAHAALGARTPGRIESQQKATAAAAAKYSVNEHPHGAGGKFKDTGKGTHSHQQSLRGY